MDQAFDFCSSTAYVTHGANATPIPAVINGYYGSLSSKYGTLDCGWEDALSSADRNAAIDARLASINYVGVGVTANFRWDMPAAGTFAISAAFGDASTANGPFTAQIYDNTTLLATIVNNLAMGGAEHFFDANGVERSSAAAWVSGNTKHTLTFATTTFRCRIIGGAGAAVIAHLRIEDAAAPPSILSRRTRSELGTRSGSRQVAAGILRPTLSGSGEMTWRN